MKLKYSNLQVTAITETPTGSPYIQATVDIHMRKSIFHLWTKETIQVASGGDKYLPWINISNDISIDRYEIMCLERILELKAMKPLAKIYNK